MRKTVENTNLKRVSVKDFFKDSKEFFKNFSSIFAVEKNDDNNLETLTYNSNETTAKTARELERSLNYIESDKFENDILNIKSVNISEKPKSLRKGRAIKYDSIDQSLRNQPDITKIDNEIDR